MAKLLVVDDDPIQLDLRRQLLGQAGHEVHIAETGEQAQRLLAELSPDVLLMDLRLPELSDGLRLIRAAHDCASAPRIIVLAGWPADLDGHPEERLVNRVLGKPLRTELLLRAIRDAFLLLLLCCVGLRAEVFPFNVRRGGEVVAEVEMSSPGSDWSRQGREAALASLTLDGRESQHIMLYAGERRFTYSAFLGALPPGAHRLEIVRDPRYSAPQSGLKLWGAHFREVTPEDPDWLPLAHAPVLYARADSIGEFTDIPLISYCERLEEDGRPLLQYTVIFSNEDGGTSTRALMARWGRTTDVEYIYRAWLDASGKVARATIQADGHKEIPFQGRLAGAHPVLIPSTRNNMVSPDGESPIRYQIPPVVVDLSHHSREEVMDRHPIAYLVMAQELARERKLRPYGAVDQEKVSDPRHYLYLEAEIANRDSALNVLVRLRGEAVWHSSDLGRADYAISRNGWFRTTVELPPGTRAEHIAEIAFECVVPPEKPLPLAGECRLERVSKAFLLDSGYHPAASCFHLDGAVSIPTGLTRVYPLP